MEEKNNQNKITFGTYVIIVTIVFLVLLVGILAGILIQKNKDEKVANTAENVVSNVATENETNKENVKENSIDTTNKEKEEEENDGIPLSLEDEKIKEIAEKFHFETAVQASIYKTGSFNLNNIPNDLILRMAWDKLEEDDVTLDYGDGANTETATQKVMNKSVENIFGKSIKYKDASFENVVSKTFDGYNLNKGTISYSNGIYTADYLEGGGGSVPYIYQKAQKAIEYNGDRIEIYVKTAFINPKDYDEEKDDWIYYIYSDYDFNTETFKNEILKISESEFHKENQYSYGYPSITITDNKNMDSIEDKLDTYVYTFSINNSTGDYYLSGFNKIEK